MSPGWGHIPGVGLCSLGSNSATVAGPAGRRQEGPGQQLGSPSLSLCSWQELQPVVWRGRPQLLLHAGPHPPRQVSSLGVGVRGRLGVGAVPRAALGQLRSVSWGRGQALHPSAPQLRAPWALPCPRSKCGTLPPESCFFSLICSLGSFMGKCPLPGEQGRERGWLGGLQVSAAYGRAVFPSCSHPGGAATLRPPPGASRAVSPQHLGAGHRLGLRCWPHHGRQLSGKASPRGVPRGRVGGRGP